MSENKYYTPTIEEFHIGFEYEILDPKQEWIKQTWRIHNFSEGRFKANLEVYNSVRAKCLDKEDIESLGWKEIEPYGYSFKDKFFLKTGKIKDESGVNRFTNINNGSFPVFIGNANNKSEFKKLMIQLGIK